MLRFTLEPRAEPSLAMRFAGPAIAMALTVIAASIMLAILGLDPVETLRVFFFQPLSSLRGLSELALRASPLILIALGLAIGFRANVWNIGAEGMFIVGAICASWVALTFGEGGHFWMLPAMAIAGIAGGASWAAIAAYLRVAANTNEILVTLMLNYVATLILSYLVHGPWRDPEGFNYPQTAIFDPSAMFPHLFRGLRINASIFITLGAVVVAWLFVERSFVGFRMSVGGITPKAARYAGYSENQAVWLGLLIGGGAAGLAGMMEAAGPLGQLSPTISPGYGYAAIIVAFVGRLNAIGILFAGLLLSLLYLGGEAAQVALHLPAALTRTFQGMLLFFVLAADLFIFYRLRIVRVA
jgi:simple sugar transport system permease protein